MKLFGLLISIALALGATPAMAQTICGCVKCVFFPFTYKTITITSGHMLPAYKLNTCSFARTTPDPGQLQRGDVIFFSEDGQDGTVYFFRLIGLPGDHVQMRDGQVVLNGEVLPQAPRPDHISVKQMSRHRTLPRCANDPVPMGDTCIKSRARETLPSGRSYDVLNIAMVPQDNTQVYVVPPEHVFGLGDNRDNSLDSRMPRAERGFGFVSFDAVLGVFE